MAKESRVNSIKEFVYIDEIELNSVLAQLDNGLTTVIHDMQQALSGNTDLNSKSKTKHGSGGLSAVVKAEAGSSTTLQTGNQDINQTISQEAVDTVYSDYAVNIILKELRKNKQLYVDDGVNKPVGSFISIESIFSILDFEEIHSLTTNPDFKRLIEEQGEEISKDELEQQLNGLDVMSSISNVYKEVTKGTELISVNDGLIFAEDKNFRMNSTQRKMLSLRRSSIRILGIVEAKVTDKDMDMDTIVKTDDLSTLSDFAGRTNFFLLSLLGKKILKNNDRLIKPIAIYFD